MKGMRKTMHTSLELEIFNLKKDIQVGISVSAGTCVHINNSQEKVRYNLKNHLNKSMCSILFDFYRILEKT